MNQFKQFPNIEYIDWQKWPKDHQINQTYYSFCNSGNINLSNIHTIILEKPNLVSTYLKNINIKKKEEKSVECQMFCSHEGDKDIFLPFIRQNYSKEEDKFIFYVGQKVHILEVDDFGTIKKAFKKGDNNKIDVKTQINLKKDIYFIHLNEKGEERKYRSDSFTIIHSDLSCISHYSGPPMSYIIFFVGKKTNRKHIWCAAKYAIKELKIFVQKDVIFNKITNPSSFNLESGLASKYMLC